MTYQDPSQQWPASQQHPPVPAQFGPPAAPSYYPIPVAVVPQKSSGAAVALELVPGLFGVFGVGNLYAGNIAVGVILMVSFWVLFWINVLLMFVVVGWVTMPLTWIAYLITGSLLAARSVERHNAGTVRA